MVPQSRPLRALLVLAWHCEQVRAQASRISSAFRSLIRRSADLEMIFSRFGHVESCEILKDAESGESLCYAFVEFATRKSCEEAYFKMNNVMIDNRRIKVDFSQSVSRLWAQSRRGGAMPRMPAARAGLELSQRGRIGGQVVDLRIKHSALGSRAGAAALSSRLAPPASAGPPARGAASPQAGGPVDISKAIAAARAAAGKLAALRGRHANQGHEAPAPPSRGVDEDRMLAGRHSTRGER